VTIGFSSQNKTAANDNNDSEHRIRNKRKDYVGEEITINDNRRICSMLQNVNDFIICFQVKFKGMD
jgi:hypothetical protein